MIETKPTEPVEAPVLLQDIIVLQEAIKLTEVLHLEVVTMKVVDHQELEAQDHQLHQEHQRTEILVALQKKAEQLEVLTAEVTSRTEVLLLEAQEVILEVLTHHGLQAAVDHPLLEVEAGGNQD